MSVPPLHLILSQIRTHPEFLALIVTGSWASLYTLHAGASGFWAPFLVIRSSSVSIDKTYRLLHVGPSFLPSTCLPRLPTLSSCHFTSTSAVSNAFVPRHKVLRAAMDVATAVHPIPAHVLVLERSLIRTRELCEPRSRREEEEVGIEHGQSYAWIVCVMSLSWPGL